MEDWLDETVSSGHSRAIAHMNSHWVWRHAQNLCKPKPDHIEASEGFGS